MTSVTSRTKQISFLLTSVKFTKSTILLTSVKFTKSTKNHKIWTKPEKESGKVQLENTNPELWLDYNFKTVRTTPNLKCKPISTPTLGLTALTNTVVNYNVNETCKHAWKQQEPKDRLGLEWSGCWSSLPISIHLVLITILVQLEREACPPLSTVTLVRYQFSFSWNSKRHQKQGCFHPRSRQVTNCYKINHQPRSGLDCQWLRPAQCKS